MTTVPTGQRAFADLTDEEYDGRWFDARGFRDGQALQNCIDEVAGWSEQRARDLIRRLLVQSTALGIDEQRWACHKLATGRESALTASEGLDSHGQDQARALLTLTYSESKTYNEYERRVLRYFEHLEDVDKRDAGVGVPPPWEGCTWILDLLPREPESALQALDSYHRAHVMVLPDGRWAALEDAEALIRARYVDLPRDRRDAARILGSLRPRALEEVTARLYESMGYTAELTPYTKDRGRDLIARREEPRRRELVVVECKTGKAIGVNVVRQLRGVMEREQANKGVLVTTSKFTKGAVEEARTAKLELIDGSQLSELLNKYLGPSVLSL